MGDMPGSSLIWVAGLKEPYEKGQPKGRPFSVEFGSDSQWPS
jgi:hypothetical protein